MTDETRQDAAVATEDGPKKLRQQVEIKDTGPCRKHLKVTVEREDIEARMGDHFSRLVRESNVAGFRPGKAPRKLIEKRFHGEVANQVKAEVLLASLEQLGEDHDIAPLAPPQIDPDQIEIPREGPMVYEFEVEVRPQFDLPQYRGLTLKRPVKTFANEDVSEARRRLLASYGQIVPKDSGAAELGDILVADVTVRNGDAVIGTLKESNLRVERTLAFRDGLIKQFSTQIQGVKVGETRTLNVELSSTAAGNLAGQTVQATFEIKDIKTIRLPDLTPDYCQETFGLDNVDQLDEMIKSALERNLEHDQRRAARAQVLEKITAASSWDLPQDLLERQFRRARSRRIMEMRGDGLSDQEIAKQLRLMDQDIHASTALALKEHFVLQKIAEVEKIDVDEKDVADEIERIADQTGESPRRVRARLEKDDMLEALMAEMVERKALDLILESATYEDVPLERTEEAAAEMATIDAQAVSGEMREPAAESKTEG